MSFRVTRIKELETTQQFILVAISRGVVSMSRLVL